MHLPKLPPKSRVHLHAFLSHLGYKAECLPSASVTKPAVQRHSGSSPRRPVLTCAGGEQTMSVWAMYGLCSNYVRHAIPILFSPFCHSIEPFSGFLQASPEWNQVRFVKCPESILVYMRLLAYSCKRIVSKFNCLSARMLPAVDAYFRCSRHFQIQGQPLSRHVQAVATDRAMLRNDLMPCSHWHSAGC